MEISEKRSMQSRINGAKSKGRPPGIIKLKIKRVESSRKYTSPDKYLKKKYGIGIEQKQNMLLNQNNKCLICECELTMEKAVVDHDHKTGKIRSLLCAKCNSGLGIFKENISNFENAIKYILKYSFTPSNNPADGEKINFDSIVQVRTKKELYTKQKQTDLILLYMLQGNKITSLEALKKFGCLRLGGRIYDLKKQYKNIYEIKSKLIKVDNKHIAQYWLGLDKK